MSGLKGNIYNTLVRPRITEKSANISAAQHGVVFEVHPEANKCQIKNAVEQIFNVKVEQVKTLCCKGKKKRVRTHVGEQKSYKKAYVTLKEGYSVDVVEGL
jgi:large subunit ribosomal protein L23